MPIIQYRTHLPASDSPATTFRGPRGQLKHRCGLCGESRGKLSICTACNTVRYCSRDHQAEDRPRHKSECTNIKKLRTKLAKEEDLVRNATPDFMTPANAFEESVGHFWGIVSTRDYMRARFALADAIRRIGTLDGVTEALSHLQDMIRLCRSDNMGVRDLIPGMMLQLDRDQEAYDFIKWYETEGQRSDYDWGDMDLPFLNIRMANPFEDVSFMDRTYSSLNNVAAVMLLKMKLLIDFSNIRLTRQVLAGKIPVELWRVVEQYVIRSPISTVINFPLLNSKDLAMFEDDISLQIKELGGTLRNSNEHFLGALLDPDEFLEHRPGYYSRGSQEEVMLKLQYSFPAWWQHEGVLELLQSAKAIAAKDSDIEIDDMMKSRTFKNNPGSDRTRAEMLDNVSRNRLWGYIDWAIEDSRSLGEEKPSDRHMREIHERYGQSEEEGETDEDDDGNEVDQEETEGQDDSEWEDVD